jgi:prepilin-type N-terminal cleavage/methylation domain-containing protein
VTRQPPVASRSQGFTLVEILVVIAIISVLAGLVLASVTAARKYADVKATQQEILTLAQGISSYNTQFGDYPPSFLVALKVKGNGINEGNEALILCLSGRKKGGPFHEDWNENRMGNLDQDSLAAKDFQILKKDLDIPQIAPPQLLEYLDVWGNPFVYIHNRDYNTKTRLQYMDRDFNTIQVSAAKSVKMGTYEAPTSYQIWSFGPNGVNENGEGDDIASWK